MTQDLSVTRRLTADAAPFAVFNIEESVIVGPTRDQGCVVVAWTIAQPDQAATRFLRSVRVCREPS